MILQVDRAAAIARLDALRLALHADARIPRLSASVGAASVPEDGGTRVLIEVADRRLYATKAADRNRTVAEDYAAA